MTPSGGDNGDLRYAKMQDVLRARAASLAQSQEEEVSVDALGLLLFRLGEEWYAFPIDGVREIYNDFMVTRIPRVPEFILGVVNVRGEIVSVTDLGTLIRVPSRTHQSIESVMPAAIIVANESSVTAVVVDEIGDIVEVPHDSIEAALSTLDKAQAEFMAGSVYLTGRLVGLVNLRKILEPIGETV
ncbi:MAG: purine-binding chemotaxis protein CheW [Actinobacteria bacterium]|nr:purine-binding chemotaxis protein CheW [Actinomycetota bacterium]